MRYASEPFDENKHPIQDVQLTGSNVPDNQRIPAKLLNATGLEATIAVYGSVDSWGTDNPGLLVATMQGAFNGTAWDRWRNNTEGTLLASAARTVSTVAPIQTNHNAKGIHIQLNITAASGTGGLTIRLRGSDPASGNLYVLTANPSAVTAAGLYVCEYYPGVSDATTGTGLVKRASLTLPRTFEVAVVHSDSSSYSYSLAYSLIL